MSCKFSFTAGDTYAILSNCESRCSVIGYSSHYLISGVMIRLKEEIKDDFKRKKRTDYCRLRKIRG